MTVSRIDPVLLNNPAFIYNIKVQNVGDGPASHVILNLLQSRNTPNGARIDMYGGSIRTFYSNGIITIGNMGRLESN